jgi:hypothetical protein
MVQMTTPPGWVLAIPEALGLAASKTFSMRPRRREAVSPFSVQIGLRTASTSSVAMLSTGLARRGAA